MREQITSTHILNFSLSYFVASSMVLDLSGRSHDFESLSCSHLCLHHLWEPIEGLTSSSRQHPPIRVDVEGSFRIKAMSAPLK